MEYNKMIYKLFILKNNEWIFVKTFNSRTTALDFVDKYHAGKKFDIEVEESWD